MASEVSASVATGNYGQWQIVLDQVSQNAAANTSVVRVRGIVINTSPYASYNNNGVGWSVGGAGSTSGSTALNVGGNSSQTMFDVQFTIGHDANGYASPSFSAHLNATGTSNIGGPADVSATITLDRIPKVPSAPYGYSARNITTSDAYTTGIQVSDNGGAAMTDIQAEYNTSQSDTGAKIADAGTWADPHMTGLVRATTYYFRCRVYNSVGWSGWGGWASFTTPSTVPDQPAAPTASSIQSTSVYLSWTAPNNGGSTIDYYQVQIATDSGFSNVVSQTQVTGPGTFGGLTRATTYYARVIAHNGVGWSAWSPATSFTSAATVPDQQAAPVVSSIQQNGATVTWSAPNNGGSAITSYNAQIATDSGFTNVVATGTASGWAPTTLNPGTTYYVRTRANNAVGSGPWSPTTTFTTLSGAKVRVSGTFTDALVYAHVSGAWTPAQTFKHVSGAWTA